MRVLFLGLALALAAGCSTSPVSEGEAERVPSERIYASDLVGKAQGDQASVLFLRDTGILGVGCTHDIYVNNRKVFSIRAGEGISLKLQPGEYSFRLETGGGACPNVATSQDANLKPAGAIAYRILTPSDFGLRLTRIK
ncbi:DUF2846 domain-containing protein [Pseudomonas sp. PDM13]|uniref:DUF2846 domain-containing protein n=1 Tax=Pseudomonas sp. PDM13 TaxID=2769255 RepID=UPI0021E01769|nr:DUF2846 domain-containing protein [Pseudomonas sp. PDM13]MCU9949862.1 DUF2846 domain-containing protein [Pseudomonas sp. PDM13]